MYTSFIMQHEFYSSDECIHLNQLWIQYHSEHRQLSLQTKIHQSEHPKYVNDLSNNTEQKYIIKLESSCKTTSPSTYTLTIITSTILQSINTYMTFTDSLKKCVNDNLKLYINTYNVYLIVYHRKRTKTWLIFTFE